MSNDNAARVRLAELHAVEGKILRLERELTVVQGKILKLERELGIRPPGSRRRGGRRCEAQLTEAHG